MPPKKQKEQVKESATKKKTPAKVESEDEHEEEEPKVQKKLKKSNKQAANVEEQEEQPNKKGEKLVQKKLQFSNSQEKGDNPHSKLKQELGDGVFPDTNVQISSWNINGIRAVAAKPDFFKYFETLKFDIICLNETKIDEDNYLKAGFSTKIPKEYYQYLNFCKPPKSGYSGVAVYSKVKPISVRHDIGIPKHDAEGRTLTLEFDKFFLVACYVPNAGQKLDRLGYRTKEWDIDFRAYLNNLKAQKPTILCGDLNVAHEEIDIANPKTNHKSAGFTPQERQGFTYLLADGWNDSFRRLNGQTVKYSYFSARTGAREKNAGWRLDYFVIDDAHKEAITHSDINNTVYGSDHTPIEITLDVARL